MNVHALRRQLQAAGRRIAGWQARVNLCLGLAAVLLGVWLFSLLDLCLRYGRISRVAVWLVVMGLLGAAAWWTARALGRHFGAQAVAAMIEKAFPQLDNRLINYLQFAADPDADAFKQAYVSHGVPEWQGLNLGAMRDRRLHRRALLALAGALALCLLPGAFLGQAWAIAVWRVVNPFTDTRPATLTHILSVTPGDATVLQGSPLVLTCTVQGRRGHPVHLDLDPADREPTTYALGRIAGSDPQTFTYRLPRVNTGARYRFRAGDAAFPAWYRVDTRPPLAFVGLDAAVAPPGYTRLKPGRFDALTQDVVVPQGSELDLQARFNLPLQALALVRGKAEQPLAQGEAPTAWRGKLPMTDETPARLVAAAANGDRAEQALRLTFLPDRLPEIQVLAPEGRPVLTAGAAPLIAFTVSDDYGLQEVAIEQVSGDSAAEADGRVVQRWEGGGAGELTQTWTDEEAHSRTNSMLAYRIVARDNCPFGDASRAARSAVIVFATPTAKQVSQQRNELEKAAHVALAQVIELQQRNLNKTRALQENLEAAPAAQWQEAAQCQERIRGMTKTLLANPLNPLGNLTASVKKVYLGEMADVIPVLGGLPDAAAAERAGRAERAVGMEEKILRQLTLADVASAKSGIQQRVSALAGMLGRMIREEDTVRKQTQSLAEQLNARAGKPLIERQDNLALDVTDFVSLCRSESSAATAGDEKLAALLLALADQCEQQKVRGDMMMASEKLEQGPPAAAVPHESEALRKLQELLARLDEIQAQEKREQEEALLEALEEAKKRIAKLEEIQRKALESMDAVADQKDKNNKETDKLEEEYEELEKNLKEAMLQIPTDLNVFMELNVANDLVEDVFTVFEEIRQAPGSENMGAGDVTERALAKREEYLAGMQEARERIDALEQWLADKPDSMKITAEPFDKEEMPKAGMALGALTTEAEDLIGDLLQKNEEMAEQADDGAINTGVPDTLANAEVKEGDVSSFAAQGKSGNETPDHKEQDGRSNVGRQGMADGETAAGSGTISEGDKNIEARRTQEPTQSGQVDVEGEDVQTKATGGGKLGTGKADEAGMAGGVERMDSMEAGSAEGLEALMAQQADALYAKASMQNVRADALKNAAHHIRQSADAIARGNIAQLKEHRKMALAALKKAKAQMDEAATGSFNLEPNPSMLDDVVEGGPELAPAKYRDQVAEYYKALSSGL